VNEFAQRVAHADPSALRAESIEILQVNVGLRCNSACAHCHQSCSPDRTEIMDADTMDAVVRIVSEIRPALVDITGGAPELHPRLRAFVVALTDARIPVQVRTNLTVLLEPPADSLVRFFAQRGVRLLASLPALSESSVESQRPGSYTASIAALRLLSSAGYGHGELRLDIAVNPTDESLPRSAEEVRAEFREALTGQLGIPFDEVVLITNTPVGRFRDRLERAGALDAYLDTLRDAFNPITLARLSCRTTLEVGWDGRLADCDFNLGAGLSTAGGVPQHIREFDADALASRPLRFAEHCYSCTASAGSG